MEESRFVSLSFIRVTSFKMTDSSQLPRLGLPLRSSGTLSPTATSLVTFDSAK